MKVVVVGAGVMGSATARALARRGHDVTLLERFEVGHARGSSHGSSRIFRFSYPDATYVRMAQEARPLWDELASELGETMIVPTGGIDVGPHVTSNVEALRSCGAEAEPLTAREVTRRWPHITLPEGPPIMFTPDSGIVLADVAWSGLVRSGQSNGVRLLESTRVTELEPGDAGVTVETERGAFVADSCVVTAGAWGRSLLAEVGIELPVRPTRETLAYFDSAEEEHPVVVDWSEPAIYSQPAPGRGLKVGEHIAGPEADPEAEGEPDPASLARLKDWVAQRFPRADPEPTHAETCFYTNTADASFILERHGSIVVGSPCSGHGFKFAPLIGERLADLVEEN